MGICSSEEVKRRVSLNTILMDSHSHGWEVEFYCFMNVIGGKVL